MNKKLNVAESVTPQVETIALMEDKKALGKRKLETYMKEEMRTVKGIFQFFECPGMSAKITVKKYPGHIFEKEMTDGKEYEIPLYVARFLNGIDVTAEAIGGKLNTCGYPVHTHIMDKNGLPIISHEKIKRSSSPLPSHTQQASFGKPLQYILLLTETKPLLK